MFDVDQRYVKLVIQVVRSGCSLNPMSSIMQKE